MPNISSHNLNLVIFLSPLSKSNYVINRSLMNVLGLGKTGRVRPTRRLKRRAPRAPRRATIRVEEPLIIISSVLWRLIIPVEEPRLITNGQLNWSPRLHKKPVCVSAFEGTEPKFSVSSSVTLPTTKILKEEIV